MGNYLNYGNNRCKIGGIIILNKKFGDVIVYNLYVDLELLEKLKSFNNSKIEVLRELYF